MSDLFNGSRLSEVFDAEIEGIKKEIDGLPKNVILQEDLENLAIQLVSKYEKKQINILWDQIVQEEPQEATRIERGAFRIPQEVRATKYTIIIPFEGDPSLLRYRPNSWTEGGYPVIRSLHNQEIHLIYDETPSRDALNQHRRSLEQEIGSCNEIINRYNEEIKTVIRKCIRERRQHLEAGLAAAKSLGIPIRKRGDPPKAFSFPIKPREIPLVQAKGEKPSVPPNPILEKAIYENILEVCLSMSLVMERNPSTFSSFGEEPIRDLFLVVLNAFFQGGATGETFNRSGKTDILVRHQNKNLFIAECKLWKGESELLKAMNQLLIYDTWRDPHNAIFIFNTDVKISTIYSKIDEIVKKHPNCKKTFDYDSPLLKSDKGTRGYLFSQPSDTGSEIQITFMIFDIPKSGQ